MDDTLDFRLHVQVALTMLRKTFSFKNGQISIAKTLVVGGRPIPTSRGTGELLQTVKTDLMKSNALLSVIMAHEERMLQAAQAGKIRAGTVPDLQARIQRARDLRETVAQIIPILNPAHLASPDSQQQLRRLVEAIHSRLWTQPEKLIEIEDGHRYLL